MAYQSINSSDKVTLFLGGGGGGLTKLLMLREWMNV